VELYGGRQTAGAGDGIKQEAIEINLPPLYLFLHLAEKARYY
jgi:hypothetical protein